MCNSQEGLLRKIRLWEDTSLELKTVDFPGQRVAEGIVKLTKSSSSDPQDTGLQSVANPPYWAPKAAVSLNLTMPDAGALGLKHQHTTREVIVTASPGPRPRVNSESR